MTPTVDGAGLRRESVSAWLAATLPELDWGDSWTAEILAGGLSNITYRLRGLGRSMVLRRPPVAGGLPSAHDMAREFTVQRALVPSIVPVPVPFALCEDLSVLGAPFYVMSDVSGRVLRDAHDTAALSVEGRGQLSHALVETLVALHALDIETLGLGDLGWPHGYAARQIRRWGDQWQRSATRSLPDMTALISLLAERVPTDVDSALVHGDFRLDNTVVDVTGSRPRINAVLDWELSTLGDPLADLGLFLTYWEDSHLIEGSAFPQLARVTSHAGFPNVDVLAQAYAALSGRDLKHLGFYRALGAMKLAVILEGVHARYLSGQTLTPGYERVGAAVPVFAARGLELLR